MNESSSPGIAQPRVVLRAGQVAAGVVPSAWQSSVRTEHVEASA